jgi:dipeptidyl aminopeptidase/acylaminoacyl peptidase
LGKEFAVVRDYWCKNRNTKTFFVNLYNPTQDPRIIFDRSSEDLYSDPGEFVTTYNQWNRPVLMFSKNGQKIYLQGQGYSAEGNRPFLDEFDISTFQTKRVWRADGKATYENIVRVVDVEKQLLITSIESPKVFPNLFFRNYGSSALPKQLTQRENPYKALMNVSKQKIFYKRNDGVQLSATLYLPPGYDKNKSGRLPMLMSAYPQEFKDDKAAGQVKESPYMFTRINWASPLFWCVRGYAVLEDAEFPIIGKGKAEPNDTYLEQLVADADAAIRAVDSIGVVDPKRCAVMGHSYGAFMTANLLTHSTLFAAGIARSGAYNRTLTPFGFQAEERTYWKAQEVYNRMSPFNYADKIKTPLLLIHGDADNNPGTFTLQSERLFQAIKGNGGKARLVLLPYESHSYAARENILHMLWEMDTWLEKYVATVK